jgi:16S rRNA C967 or C1407 C5-methylase (RsmB/RsmF family)
MTLEDLLQQSLLPLELTADELQQLSNSLQNLPARSIRRLRNLPASQHAFFEALTAVPWNIHGYWWDESRGRPGGEPLYAAGGYFIQDAASMLPLTPSPATTWRNNLRFMRSTRRKIDSHRRSSR